MEYYCRECKNTFDEPEIEVSTYEDYYGVGSDFIWKTRLELEICPYCGSEDLGVVEEDIEEEEEEEE